MQINIYFEDAYLEYESALKSYLYGYFKNLVIVSAFGLVAGLVMRFISFLPGLGILIGGVSGAYLAIIYLLYKYYLHSIKRQRKFMKDITILITEMSVSIKNSDLSERKLYWKIFNKVFENQKFYIMFTLTGRSVVIPKSRINDEEKHWSE